MQLHGPEVAKYLQSSLGRGLFRLAVSPSNILAVLTPWWKNILSKYNINKRVFVIPNPISNYWKKIAQQKKPSLSNSSEISILAMSRIEKGKGFDLLIESVPLLSKEFKFLIAGDGASLLSLKNRVSELHLQDRVRFYGWVSGDDKLLLFQQADIFCLPSINDSFGMGYIEAMSFGLPVIAMDRGAIPDVVPHSKCGILIKDYSSISLANALNQMSSKALREKMGKAGKQWVLDNYSYSQLGPQLQKMFNSI